MKIAAKDIPVIQLPVKNLERSVKWYQETLGLGFTFEFNPGDDEAWMRIPGGIGLGLIRCHDVPRLDFYNARGELNPILTFQVDDNIHDVYEELKSRGVEVSDMIYRGGGGGHSFNFRDPDGHLSNLWGGWEVPPEE